jgi:hypothetical protein
MTIMRGGRTGSGLDRALEDALSRQLDRVLESGELADGTDPPPTTPLPPGIQPRRWQRGFNRNDWEPPGDRDKLRPPAMPWDRKSEATDAGSDQAPPSPAADAPAPPSPAADALASPSPVTSATAQAATKPTVDTGPDEPFRFRPHLTGVVMVHGIGPHLAGQTLLDWARPIITLLSDAVPAHDKVAYLPHHDGRHAADPVYKSSIDFSGETFPVIHLRIPRRKGETSGADKLESNSEPRWILTETWWASEILPPSLRTMVSWLGEQGGVGRIVQGIQENSMGSGAMGLLGRISFQPFVSVIVTFALLLFVLLLGISRLVPFGPLRNAVTLQLASSFLTDWFGGARTLLKDPAQSANVRGRLVSTIKALRAYGCRDIVLVAHSGGAMVSLMTLTDPAYPYLRVQKLITLGEAINLGERLEQQNPDDKTWRPQLPPGSRLGGDLGKLQPHLQWRDFFASHDPAPCGPPRVPAGLLEVLPPRFTAERVYNLRSIGGDHGSYWDNDEQFLIPLVREIDVPRGDRTMSRFFSDEQESFVRARRKERVGMLSLWRRVTGALPVLAILVVLVLGSPGIVREAGDAAMTVFRMIPGHELLETAGAWLADRGNELALTGWPASWPAFIRESKPWDAVYGLGLLAIQAGFVLAVLNAVAPKGIDRLWWTSYGARAGVFFLDSLVAPGLLLAIGAAWVVTRWDAAVVRDVGVAALWLVLAGGIAFGLSKLGEVVRRRLREVEGQPEMTKRAIRAGLIAGSALFLSAALGLVLVVALGVAMVFAGSDGRGAAAAETRQFVLGGLAVLILFQLLQRVGTWRWNSWDARERQALRRRPSTMPFRTWPRVIATLLTLAAVMGALIVAFGGQGTRILFAARETWIGLLLTLVVAIVLGSIAKDVVDNDIDATPSGGGAGSGDEPAPVMPPVSGEAAGSQAG